MDIEHAHGAPGGDRPPGHGRRSRRRVVAVAVVGALALLGALIVAVTDVPPLTALGALLLGLVIVRLGWFFLAQFATPPPPPPDPGTLRRVRLVYRCPVCGAEVRMTSAASEDPEPPRHCMEEMELVATAEDAL
jgi:hypothetical protein